MTKNLLNVVNLNKKNETFFSEAQKRFSLLLQKKSELCASLLRVSFDSAVLVQFSNANFERTSEKISLEKDDEKVMFFTLLFSSYFVPA